MAMMGNHQPDVKAIGSNMIFPVGIYQQTSLNRYCLDMSQVFCELERVCRPTSRLIFIVGRESTVRGARIFNGEIVAEIAQVMGFDLILRQERVFLNRFGQNIFEDILHFSLPKEPRRLEFLADARQIAGAVLEAAYPLAPDESKNGIKAALEEIEAVKPSPILDLLQTQRPLCECGLSSTWIPIHSLQQLFYGFWSTYGG